MGAYPQGCSCQKHVMGGGLLVQSGLLYEIDMPVENDLNKPGSFVPEWIPAEGTGFVYHSPDPFDCILLKLRVRASTVIVVEKDGESIENRKLLGGIPTVHSMPGTYAQDPQNQKFWINICGGVGGSASYVTMLSRVRWVP